MVTTILGRIPRLHATVLAVGSIIALLLVSAVPAGATVIERERWDVAFADGYDFCGFPVDVEGEASGQLRIREGKGDNDSAFFLRENYRYTETHTNADTGAFLTIEGHGVFNEVSATRITGDVFEFTAIDAGQPFVVTDSAGDVVLRQRGVVRATVLFDTGGDDVPGGNLLGLEFDVRGPHPGFGADFCDIITPLIGS